MRLRTWASRRVGHGDHGARNPTLTVQALAWRTADIWLRTGSRYPDNAPRCYSFTMRWCLLAALIAIGGVLCAFQMPFREYPGIEYNDFPLPPDYQQSPICLRPLDVSSRARRIWVWALSRRLARGRSYLCGPRIIRARTGTFFLSIAAADADQRAVSRAAGES